MTRLTTTGYALLGLLALHDWSAYELTQQVQRVLRFVLPRADSKLYAAAKRLVELGLATSRQDGVGARPRTVYAITPAGQAALRAWLREPGTGPTLEFDAALKLFFADSGTQDDALATIESVLAWADGMLAFGAALGREYVATDGGPYPERLHVNALVNEFLIRHATMVQQWAEWSRTQVLDWRGVGPQPHRHGQDLQTYVRSAASTAMTQATTRHGLHVPDHPRYGAGGPIDARGHGSRRG